MSGTTGMAARTITSRNDEEGMTVLVLHQQIISTYSSNVGSFDVFAVGARPSYFLPQIR